MHFKILFLGWVIWSGLGNIHATVNLDLVDENKEGEGEEVIFAVGEDATIYHTKPRIVGSQNDP